MPGLVPGIHVFLWWFTEWRRGWPGRARPWRVLQSGLRSLLREQRL